MSSATATLLHPSTPAPVAVPDLPVARPALRPVHRAAPAGAAVAVKHTFDFVAALVALLVLAPLLVVLALAVKASSSGPVLYRQRRIGRDGRAFDIFKFRSMRPDTVGATFSLSAGAAPGGVEGIDRRTRVGRLMRSTSLDELPQLINVVRGEMSLVGPRPEHPEFAELFADEVPGYADRHRMRVGITGLSQVSGLRGQSSIAERAAVDNQYIESWSIRRDLVVLARTVRVVLAGEAE